MCVVTDEMILKIRFSLNFNVKKHALYKIVLFSSVIIVIIKILKIIITIMYAFHC